MAKGPGTNEHQIKVLQGKVGEEGQRAADAIMASPEPEVIALAYKRTRANATKSKLPKSVTKRLGNLSDEDAALVRSKLASAKC